MADKIGKAITGYQNLVPAPNDREGTAAVKLMATRYGCKYKYTYMGTRWYRGSTCKREVKACLKEPLLLQSARQVHQDGQG